MGKGHHDLPDFSHHGAQLLVLCILVPSLHLLDSLQQGLHCGLVVLTNLAESVGHHVLKASHQVVHHNLNRVKDMVVVFVFPSIPGDYFLDVLVLFLPKSRKAY